MAQADCITDKAAVFMPACCSSGLLSVCWCHPLWYATISSIMYGVMFGCCMACCTVMCACAWWTDRCTAGGLRACNNVAHAVLYVFVLFKVLFCSVQHPVLLCQAGDGGLLQPLTIAKLLMCVSATACACAALCFITLSARCYCCR
jgi:hypothetical protein